MDRTTARQRARQMAGQYLADGQPTGWYEALYQQAQGDDKAIAWADMTPNPNLIEWLDQHAIDGVGKRALVVGCGLGDDAQELARRGFKVVGFDISPTAIEWCQRRWTTSPVEYVTADLLNLPPDWEQAFDFVLEIYTLQALAAQVRPPAIRGLARLVPPGGRLLIICRGREPGDDPGLMPWPLTKAELELLQTEGLREVAFEDYFDRENPPARRFRAVYQR